MFNQNKLTLSKDFLEKSTQWHSMSEGFELATGSGNETSNESDADKWTEEMPRRRLKNGL